MKTKKKGFGKIIALLLVAALCLGSFGISGNYSVFAAESTDAAVEQAADESVDTAEADTAIETDASDDAAVSVDVQEEADSTQSVDSKADTKADTEEAVEAEAEVVEETADAADDADDAEELMPAQNFKEELKQEKLTVSVQADEGAFPAGTTMKVKAVSDKKTIDKIEEAALEEVGDKVAINDIQAVDISFWNDGEEIEPEKDIVVMIASDLVEDNDGSMIVHVNDEDSDKVSEKKKGKAEVVEQMTESRQDKLDINPASDEVVFEADQFSVYAVVGTTGYTTLDSVADQMFAIYAQKDNTPYAVTHTYGDGYDGDDITTSSPSVLKGEAIDSLVVWQAEKADGGYHIYYGDLDDSSRLHYLVVDENGTLSESKTATTTWSSQSGYLKYQNGGNTGYLSYDNGALSTEKSITSAVQIFFATVDVNDEYYNDGLGPVLRAANDDKAPAHSKTLTPNGDGTYTLALNVTGSTSSSSTTTVTKANVILVLDTSNSMNSNYTTYNGTRMTRLAAEKRVLTDTNGIIDSMLSQNVAGDPIKSDIIEIAIANFGTRGSTAQSFTTNATTLKNTINGLTNSQGTNWEEGLMRAQELASSIKTSQPDEEVYVIFLTDGEPTTHNNSYTVNTNYASEWGYASDNARAIVTAGHHFYGIFTWGSNNSSHYLSSLVQYAYSGSGNSSSSLSPLYANYFTDATDTEKLIQALTQITHDITTGVGYTNVELEDGVTTMTASNIKTNAGGAVTGLKYYRSGGDYDSSANGGLGEEWTDAPPATINDDGEVDWDLGNTVLENGVTYTVTFVVWPKQESVDLVADLNNGIKNYDELTPEQKSQINVSGGKYTLKTNTDYPTVTYSTVTTTTVDGQETTVISDPTTVNITNPDPVDLAEAKMTVEKKWEDSLDSSQREEVGGEVVLDLNLDETLYLENITLNETNDWKLVDYVSIAPGLMVTEDSPAYDADATQVTYGGVTYAILETGHDYIFEEDDINSHYELTAYSHHPMLVNGTVKYVTFEYDADGKITGITDIKDADTLSATNTLKGGINLEKKVVNGDGEAIEWKKPFTMTMHLQNPDGTDYSYDYRIYYGENNPDYATSGDKHRSEHIYGSGTATVTIYQGDVVRFVNVNDGTIFYVSEDDQGDFELDGIEYTADVAKTDADGTKWYAVKGNTASDVTVTNKLKDVKVSLQGEKTWSDSNNAFGTRPESITIKLMQILENAAEDVKAEVVKTITVTPDADGKWSYNFSDLPKYTENGIRILYSVVEEAVENYSTDYSEVDFDEEKGVFTADVTNKNVAVTFPVKKVVSVPEGMTGPANWSYTINVAANDGAPAAKTMTGTVTNTADTATFGPFVYTKAGTYTYTVTEDGTVAGVTNDSAAKSGKTVTVTVAEENGVLTATVDSTTDEPLTFTNTYSVKETTASFPVQKVMSVPEGLDGPETWSYDITVEAQGDAPVAETMTGTVTNTADTVTFGEITYTAPGTYTYKVTEAGEIDGVTNDSEATTGKTVTVTVVDNKDGTLTATASSTDESPLTFTNTYNVGTATVSFPVKKDLEVPEGLEGPETWSYDITVEAQDGAPEAETMTGAVTNEADTVTFGDFTYTAPGTYTYKVTEAGEIAGVTNDSEATSGKTVTVTVVDNGDGTLTATADSTTASPLTFTNTYSVESTTASFPVQKVMSVPEGMTGPETWSYDITVEAQGDAPVAETMTGTVTNTADTVTFGEITYTAPGTYTYKVTEAGEIDGVTNDSEATTGKTVTVTVVDNKDGTLTATASSTTASPLTFTNTYSVSSTTASFPVKKVMSVPEGMTGPETWSYTVTAEAQNGAPVAETMEGTVSNTSDTITFGDITYTAPGTYTYKVTETGTVAGVTNDSQAATGKTVTVTVVDNGNGTLTATADSTTDEPLTFTNTYGVSSTTASFPVKKVVAVPAGMTGPETWSYDVKVEAQDGAPVAETMTGTVTNEADTVTFGEITYTAPGTYTYKVTESGKIAGVENDPEGTTGKTVTVTVVDNQDGTMTATADSTADSPLTFTNNYNVGSTTVSFPVTKVMSVPEGLEGPTEWSYTIDVTANDGAPAAETMTGTVSNGAAKTTFGPFTYTAPGTYTYTVTETGTIAGVTNDAESASGKTVTVTVVDNKDGTLTATADATDASPVTFTNTYDVEETTANFPVQKVMSVPEDLDGPTEWSYTITAEAQDGAPVAETMTGTVTNTADTVTFGDITYTAPGTYTYKITETGEIAGVTNDSQATTGKIVTVTVVDNHDGTMTATASSTEEAPLQFTNTYSVENTTANFPVEKILEVPEGLTPASIAKKFTFTLTAADGTPMPATTSYTNPDADGGSVTFGDITYTTPGTYTYTVTETGKVDGVTNDKEASKTVTVEVVDNHDGTMTATADSTDDSPLQFTNTYSVESIDLSFPVQKILSVPEGFSPKSIAEVFTFTLTAADGIPMPATTSYKNPDADGGTVTFGAITYTAPGTYIYKVTETGSAPGVTNDPVDSKFVRVVVTDNGDGTLSAVATYTEADLYDTTKAEIPEEKAVPVIFTNTYNADATEYAIEGTKVLEGRTEPLKAGEFTFELKDAEGNVLQTATNDAEGNFAFAAIEYDKPGTTEYTVDEVIPTEDAVEGVTYDTTVYEVIVTVVDDGEGQLVASSTVKDADSIVFTNVFTPGDSSPTGEGNLTVSKAFVDETGKALSVKENQFSFVLTPAEGSPGTAETVGNAADGSVSFANITFEKSGDFEYTIREVKGTAPGVTYDETVYTVIAHVEPATGEDGKAYLKVTWSIKGSEDTDIVFTNPYETPKKTVYSLEQKDYVDGEEVQPGDTLTYSITYNNPTGADAAVTIEDKVPANTTYNAGSAKAVDADGKEVKATITEGETIKWEMTVPKDGSVTVSFDVTVAEHTNGEVLKNDATVNDGTNEYTTNEVTNPTPKDPEKDVKDAEGNSIKQVENEDGSTTYTNVKKGDILTYEVTYTNTTGKDVANVVITDAVPEYTKFVSAENGGTLGDDGVVTWTIDSVENGGERTVSFKVQVLRNNGEDIANTANVTVNDHPYVTNEVVNKTPKYLDLDVSKTISTYEDSSDATFVFSVKAYDVDGTKVYDDIVTLTFNAATTRTATLVEKVPEGGRVEVEEIYGGAAYQLASEGSVEFTDYTEKQTASFTNEYDDTLNHGYGILNKYTTPDGKTWPNPENGSDSATPATTAE